MTESRSVLFARESHRAGSGGPWGASPMRATMASAPESSRGVWRGARFEWWPVLRMSFVALLFGLTSSSYLHTGFDLRTYSVRVLFGALLISAAMTGLHFVWLLRGRVDKLRYLELIVEQGVWTALIHVTGGVTSGATALYGLTCLSGAIVIGMRGPVLAAVAAAMFYSLFCSAMVAGIITPPPDQLRALYATEPREIVYPFLINLLVLTLVAVLAENLAQRLKLAGGRLAEANRRAEDAERLATLGRIAAGLAHEIRNPLGSILGSVQLITSAAGVSEEARHLCGIVERETARLNDLVEDMMQLARPRRPVLVAVDLVAIASEVVTMAAQSGRGSDVVVRLQAPTRSKLVLARADASQVRQVMWNLLRNAIQASSPGAEVVLRLELGAPLPGGGSARASFEVQDDGPGIPDEARARLFDAFFTTRSNGIGMGLALVKRIVDEHGWEIEVDSWAGRGAVFRIRFPTLTQRAPHPSSPALPRAKASPFPDQ